MGLSGDVYTLVLEQDGTEVDSDSFQCVAEGATLIILASGQEWKKGVHPNIYFRGGSFI